MAKTKIFIDAGHNDSGWNTGAVANGLREQDISFEVARRLGEILKNQGIEIKLSRPTKETNLGSDNKTAVNLRWQMSNSWKADYFISLHCNAGGGTGAETFYFRDDAREFATIVQNTYSQEMGLINRKTEKTDNLAVIKNTDHPSILLELGFIDNASDALMLRDKQQEMAQAVAKGILDFVPKKEEEQEMRYNKLEEVPEYAKETIQKLINKGLLQGDGNQLNLSEDMIRIFVINDRAGLYK